MTAEFNKHIGPAVAIANDLLPAHGINSDNARTKVLATAIVFAGLAIAESISDAGARAHPRIPGPL